MARRLFDKKRPDIRYALENGWVFCGVNQQGHLRFVLKGTDLVAILGSKPGEYRSVRNTLAWLRRHTPPPVP